MIAQSEQRYPSAPKGRDGKRTEPHMTHHAHRLRMCEGLIASDTVRCGGRWGAALQAEMAEAAAGG